MNSMEILLIIVNNVSLITKTQLFVSILIIWLFYKTYQFWTSDGLIYVNIMRFIDYFPKRWFLSS
jgi:hypothetical protein